MKIRFLTLVEKVVSQSFKTLFYTEFIELYLILRRLNLMNSFCKSLKNNNGVRNSVIRKRILILVWGFLLLLLKI
jgi:hypothetical protein